MHEFEELDSVDGSGDMKEGPSDNGVFGKCLEKLFNSYERFDSKKDDWLHSLYCA